MAAQTVAVPSAYVCMNPEMEGCIMHRFILRSVFAVAVLSLGLAAAAPVGAAPPGSTFAVAPLVSDQMGAAPTTDTHLVNAWGLARSATSPWWVADNGTSVSTLYNAAGAPFPPPPAMPLVVNVPTNPTGVVFAGVADNFTVPTDTDPTLRAASFIFDSESGAILGWRGGAGAQVAPVSVDAGAVFKGLTIAKLPDGSPLLYATDFHNAKVDVFDGSWNKASVTGTFTDPGVPGGFAPFGIQAIGSDIFVTYAKQDADAHDDVGGMSLGFVDEYDLEGNLVARVATRGQLNSPWGLAIAPASFGGFAGDLLVGNFGNGAINAYTDASGEWEYDGALRGTEGKKLIIDGLWALQFGNAGNNGNPDTLFFTAGPDDESHGLFGTILPN
jgi:uncharacterized protein (TIGR03118 family)